MAAGDAQGASLADDDNRRGALVCNDGQRLKSPRAAEASADAAREGVGPAGPTPALDRVGVV
eukprot:6210223-Pleurochrysis_carterae.AAC.2